MRAVSQGGCHNACTTVNSRPHPAWFMWPIPQARHVAKATQRALALFQALDNRPCFLPASSMPSTVINHNFADPDKPICRRGM